MLHPVDCKDDEQMIKEGFRNESFAMEVRFCVAGTLFSFNRAGTILASGYSILEDHDEKIHHEENIRKMVTAGIEAAKLLHERGLA